MTGEEPDAVFDDLPVNEYWWAWVRPNTIEVGDEIVVETESGGWKSRMEVTDVKSDEWHFETSAGTGMMIVTYSKPAALEPACPMVRRQDGFASEGVVSRVEVYR